MPDEWRLSAVEFDVVWRELGFGAPPYPLELPSPGTTDDERAEIVDAVTTALDERGVRLDDGLQDALALVAGSDVLYDGHLVLDDHIRLLAARTGDRAAAVLQHGDELAVWALPGPRLGRLVTELLPQTPPAPGQSVRLPAEVLAGALRALSEGESVWEFEETLRRAGVRGPDVRWIAGLAQAPSANGAQFGVTERGRDGGERRLGLVSWYATEEGGVIIQRQPGSEWLTIAPGDAARIVTRLDAIVAGR